jgi:hypothetical protein
MSFLYLYTYYCIRSYKDKNIYLRHRSIIENLFNIWFPFFNGITKVLIF